MKKPKVNTEADLIKALRTQELECIKTNLSTNDMHAAEVAVSIFQKLICL